LQPINFTGFFEENNFQIRSAPTKPAMPITSTWPSNWDQGSSNFKGQLLLLDNECQIRRNQQGMFTSRFQTKHHLDLQTTTLNLLMWVKRNINLHPCNTNHLYLNLVLNRLD
jgi:hypothetical protein